MGPSYTPGSSLGCAVTTNLLDITRLLRRDVVNRHPSAASNIIVFALPDSVLVPAGAPSVWFCEQSANNFLPNTRYYRALRSSYSPEEQQDARPGGVTECA